MYFLLDLTLWNYEADMKTTDYDNVTEVKIRPKTPKNNIYMEVSYIQEIQSLTNITEKVTIFHII